MNVEYIEIDKIKPYDRNAKKHPTEQVINIANSIKEFGWQQPIVIDKDGIIVIGHGRYEAAKMLKLDKVPVSKADELSDEQIKALRLADNKTNESEWDFEFLNFELDEIVDIDMTSFGFDFYADYEEQPTQQTVKPGEEIAIDDFDDDNFETVCPKCGFKFNQKG